MYIYVNTTYVEIMEKVEKVEKIISDKNISAGKWIFHWACGMQIEKKKI